MTTRRRGIRGKWRCRLAYRCGLYPPPLRSLPAVQRQYHTYARVKSDNGRRWHRCVWAAWPGRFRED